MTILSSSKSDILRDSTFNYLRITTEDFSIYKFTESSEESAFACCFSFFILNLIKRNDLNESQKNYATNLIIKSIDVQYQNFDNHELAYSKSYLQLVCFFITFLKINNRLNSINLAKYLKPILDIDPLSYLSNVGALKGLPGSGNFSMFYIVINIHANKILKIDTLHSINTWIKLHIKHMNRFGLWGDSNFLTYSMFQNGYHQYEIFEYLGIYIDKDMTISLIDELLNLRDQNGHFAPYLGGGSCYDYDAVHLLTYPYLNNIFQNKISKNLSLVLDGLFACQNENGGFCETKFVRPRSLKQITLTIKHILSSPNLTIFIERFRRNVVLQRTKHSRIHTHWTKYSREWSESNLWDTWFRLLAIARIDVFLDNNKFSEWGFVNYPGIGYHYLFKNE